MRALWLNSHDGIGAFAVKETPDPEPVAGEIRIRSRAIGLNFADVMASQGFYPGAPDPPCILGYEVAGEVDAAGAGVDRSWIDRRVIAMLPSGGHAEAVCTSAARAIPMPDGMPFADGAALPVNWLTAYHMLIHVARVRPGESVLVHMAAGGVGTAALQLLRTIGGVTTFGTASAAKHGVLREYGCTHPIDYRAADYAAEVRRLSGGAGVDVVLDPLGGEDSRKGYDLLRSGGRLVCFGFADLVRGEKRNFFRTAGVLRKLAKFSPVDMMARNKTVAGVHLGRLRGYDAVLADEMRAIVDLYAQGAIRPRIDSIFPLARAHEALQRLTSRVNVGKVLLEP